MNLENLHTSTLEKLFGAIDLRIIRQDEDVRIVQLNDENGISRTLGIVKFFNIENDLLVEVHEKILEGGLLGKTLFDSNINFDKKFIGTLQVKLPQWLKNDFDTEQDSSFAIISKISIYNDRLSNDKLLYSELIEIIPPELTDVFIDKTKQLENISLNVLSLFKSANLEVIKLDKES